MAFDLEERETLAGLARKLIDRSRRSGSGSDVHNSLTVESDSASDYGISTRVEAIEKKFEQTVREWSTNLNTVLFAVERLERRCQKIDGELMACHQMFDRLQTNFTEAKDNANEAALAFAQTLGVQMSAGIDRMDQIVAETYQAHNLIKGLVSDIVTFERNDLAAASEEMPDV